MIEHFDAVDMAELLDDVGRFDEETNNGGNREEYLKKYVIMPEGEGFKILRLLPPAKGKKLYCATRTHRLLKEGDDPKKARNLHCPRVLATIQGKKRWVDPDPTKPCPICMYCRGLWAMAEAAGGKKTAEGQALQNEYRRIKAVERYYYNCMERVLDKSGDIVDSVGPKVFACGVKLQERILRKMLGDPKMRKKGLGDVTDLQNGRDLRVVKRLIPPEMFANYDESDFEDPSSLGDPDQISKWLENLHDLAALRVVKPIEEIDLALQRYTGAVVEEKTNFDMSKYRKPAQSVDAQVTAAAEARKTEAKPNVVAPAPTGEEVLAEKDWLEGLGNKVPNA